MKKINLNRDYSLTGKPDQFPEIEIQYSVSENEVWQNLWYEMDKPKVYQKAISWNYLFRMAAAATILLILSFTGFLRFYTKTISVPAGQRLTYLLPDNSKMELNAQSVVSFHPYWFGFARTLTLDGEAFFAVQKGPGFKVTSKLGETSVFGTSFNIYSRDNDYSVTCFTGKVRVVSLGKNERVLLNPNEKAFITKDGFLRFAQEVNIKTVKSWRDNMFVFTGSPIISVLKEIERQYNIKIQFEANPGLTYTGNFSRSLSGKEVLDLVCTSLGIKFDAKSDTVYLVN